MDIVYTTFSNKKESSGTTLEPDAPRYKSTLQEVLLLSSVSWKNEILVFFFSFLFGE